MQREKRNITRNSSERLLRLDLCFSFGRAPLSMRPRPHWVLGEGFGEELQVQCLESEGRSEAGWLAGLGG